MKTIKYFENSNYIYRYEYDPNVVYSNIVKNNNCSIIMKNCEKNFTEVLFETDMWKNDVLHILNIFVLKEKYFSRNIRLTLPQLFKNKKDILYILLENILEKSYNYVILKELYYKCGIDYGK